MSDLLALGLNGLTAYRSALAAVGENVANAETPGYARRSVRLVQIAPSGSSTDLIYREGLQFDGARADRVVRAWDAFRAAEARHAAASQGRGQVRDRWLTAIETALDDSTAGIGARVTAFFNAADRLAANPGDTLNRTQMLMALEDVAGAFRTTGDSLQRVSTAIGTAADLDVDELNETLLALERLNRTLRAAPPGGSTRAALEDERDRLIDSIAGRVDVVATIGDNGLATLNLADPPGTTIISATDRGQFSLLTAPDGRLSVQLTTAAGTAGISPLTGTLAGYVDASAATADRRAALDTLAANFASQLNGWSAAGLDAAGAAGTDMLDASGGAISMRALLTDPAFIAAASPDGRPNGNLLELDAFRGAGGVEVRWTALVSANAQQLAGAKAEHAAATSWRENSFAALDETTGVDLDREAADLLRFQQAYSAAARIIQVGRETFSDLLNAL